MDLPLEGRCDAADQESGPAGVGDVDREENPHEEGECTRRLGHRTVRSLGSISNILGYFKNANAPRRACPQYHRARLSCLISTDLYSKPAG